jgi:hypothetical protein
VKFYNKKRQGSFKKEYDVLYTPDKYRETEGRMVTARME